MAVVLNHQPGLGGVRKVPIVHIDDVSEKVFEVGRAVDIAVDTAVDGMSRGKGRIMVR